MLARERLSCAEGREWVREAVDGGSGAPFTPPRQQGAQVVAILLFLAGLVSVLVTVAVVGFNGAALVSALSTTLQGPTPGMVDGLVQIGLSLQWTVTPLVGGLVLMGLARIIMLLGAINRSLRGAA